MILKYAHKGDNIYKFDQYHTYTNKRSKEIMIVMINAQLSIIAFIICTLGVISFIFSDIQINHNTNSGFPGNINPNTWLRQYGIVSTITGGVIIILNCIARYFKPAIVASMFIMFIYMLFWAYWGFVGSWLYFQELISVVGQRTVIIISVDIGFYLILFPIIVIYMIAFGGIALYANELKKLVK